MVLKEGGKEICGVMRFAVHMTCNDLFCPAEFWVRTEDVIPLLTRDSERGRE